MSNRLFIPLKKEPFEWFKAGTKTFELRGYGRQWTEKYVYSDRKAEIRKGYSGEIIGGTVGNVMTGDINEIFSKIDFKKIIPTAKSKDDAKKEIINIMGKKEKYIVFEILI